MAFLFNRMIFRGCSMSKHVPHPNPPSTAACKAVTPEAVAASKDAFASSKTVKVSASPLKAAAIKAVAFKGFFCSGLEGMSG